jgi:hypothetical protein
MLNVNKTLEKMLTAQNQSQSVGMVSYIGKEITVDGGRVKFKDGQMNESNFALTRPASSATLEIRNESGLVVSTKKLGTVPEGDHVFKWDGLTDKGEKVPNGTYTYSVVAKGINDEDIPVSIQTKTSITGVDIKSEKGGLFTPLGIVSLDDIKAIGSSGFGDGISQSTKPSDEVDGPEAALPKSAEEQIQAVVDQLSAQANKVENAGPLKDNSGDTKGKQIELPPQQSAVEAMKPEASKPLQAPEPNPAVNAQAGQKPPTQPASEKIPG